MRLLILVLALFATAFAQAHGLLLSVESAGDRIVGSAYFTNGEKAAAQHVEAQDLDSPSAPPMTALSDARGGFAFPAAGGHRYRISVFGEEGHEVQMELTAGSARRATLIERASAQSSWPPPAWAVVGGLLLASLIPVAWQRLGARRRAMDN